MAGDTGCPYVNYEFFRGADMPLNRTTCEWTPRAAIIGQSIKEMTQELLRELFRLNATKITNPDLQEKDNFSSMRTSITKIPTWILIWGLIVTVFGFLGAIILMVQHDCDDKMHIEGLNAKMEAFAGENRRLMEQTRTFEKTQAKDQLSLSQLKRVMDRNGALETKQAEIACKVESAIQALQKTQLATKAELSSYKIKAHERESQEIRLKEEPKVEQVTKAHERETQDIKLKEGPKVEQKTQPTLQPIPRQVPAPLPTPDAALDGEVYEPPKIINSEVKHQKPVPAKASNPAFLFPSQASASKPTSIRADQIPYSWDFNKSKSAWYRGVEYTKPRTNPLWTVQPSRPFSHDSFPSLTHHEFSRKSSQYDYTSYGSVSHRIPDSSSSTVKKPSSLSRGYKTPQAYPSKINHSSNPFGVETPPCSTHHEFSQGDFTLQLPQVPIDAITCPRHTTSKSSPVPKSHTPLISVVSSSVSSSAPPSTPAQQSALRTYKASLATHAQLQRKKCFEAARLRKEQELERLEKRHQEAVSAQLERGAKLSREQSEKFRRESKDCAEKESKEYRAGEERAPAKKTVLEKIRELYGRDFCDEMAWVDRGLSLEDEEVKAFFNNHRDERCGDKDLVIVDGDEEDLMAFD